MAFVENFVGKIMPTSKLPDYLKGGIIGNSKFILGDGESFDQCPYDPSHLVRNVRMKCHLLKCRRNHKYFTEKKGEEVVYVDCPNGICAAIPLPELEYHQERCKPIDPEIDYAQFRIYKNKEYQEKMKRMAAVQAKNIAAFKANGIFDEEDWEKEANGYEPGYDPRFKLVRDNILIIPPNLTRMERREFREKFIIKGYEERQKKKAEEALKKAAEQATPRDPFEILYGGLNHEDM